MRLFAGKFLSKIRRLSHVISRNPNLIFYAPKIPLYGMTTRWEQAYLRRYAQKKYSGQGEIVDLGCWLGSSTTALAMGLKNNRKVNAQERRIHAYDLFIWDSQWEKTYRNIPWKTKKPKNGDTFLDEYMEIISPWKNLIQIYKGDLNQIGWNQEYPIEILHNEKPPSPCLVCLVCPPVY